MTPSRPIIIGAGIGGLCAALDLAIAGHRPIVIERQHQIGGKMVPVTVAGGSVDGGPTVLTMLWVFEALFKSAGVRLRDVLDLAPAERLARHFWLDGSRLDLFADLDRSFQAIKALAGPDEADGFIRYHAYAKRIFDNVDDVFINAPKPTVWRVMNRLGLKAIPKLMRIDAQRSMWRALETFFQDERLRQLFGRYATYAGNNPFLTPATFNLIAHVEQLGVWRVGGGMHALAKIIGELIESRGGEIMLNTDVNQIEVQDKSVTAIHLADGRRLTTSAVIFNGDVSALGLGLFGKDIARHMRATSVKDRSLSAVTFCCRAQVGTFPLIHHNVFFSTNYRHEFEQIEKLGQVPDEPTVYICAQDREDDDTPRESDRLLVLINAPATGDISPHDESALLQLETRTRTYLARMGLILSPNAVLRRGPAEWHGLFPGTGGAIYGAAAKTWNATLKRKGSTSSIKGLYLAGGSVHPGAGVPMAALSGRMAASRALADCPSM
ncbi:MAG: phytoene desaturase family protein [Myxococcota bacterium]|nr:phytoene desaturase family protein [Myxococcota bacterium]